MTARWWMVALLVTGCAEEEPEPVDEDTQVGACGTPEDGISITVTGLVLDHQGAPVHGADVSLEERNWNTNTTVHGAATTDASGEYTLSGSDLVSVPGCWGTAVDYWVTAEFNGLAGEARANQKLFNAVDDGSLSADFSSFPIELEAPDSGQL